MIVGIDTDSYGWAAVELSDDGSYEPQWFSSKEKAAVDRRIEACRSFRLYLEQLPPESQLFVEEPLALPRNGLTTKVLCLMAGALWGQWLHTDHTWFWVDVTQWKREIIGRGGANKMDVLRFFTDQGIVHETQDLYDAHALAWYGKTMLGALKRLELESL